MKIGDQRAEHVHGGEADVLDDLLVLADRELRQQQAGERHQDREEDQVVEDALADGLAEGVGRDRGDAAQSPSHAGRRRRSGAASRAGSTPRATAGPAGRRGSARRCSSTRWIASASARSATSSRQRSPIGVARACARGPRAAPASGSPLTSTSMCDTSMRRISSSRPDLEQLARRAAPPRGRRASRRRRGCGSRRRRSCRASFSSTMMSRTRWRPIGSRPDIGSSRNTISGSLISAWARPGPLDHALREAAQRQVRARGSAPRAPAARRPARAPPRGRHAEQPADVVQVLARGQVVVEVGMSRAGSRPDAASGGRSAGSRGPPSRPSREARAPSGA